MLDGIRIERELLTPLRARATLVLDTTRLSVQELRAWLDSGEPLHLYDVRTPDEHRKARIAGATLVDARVAAEIEKLPRDTRLVFHCHHGGRSQAAAEHFAALGFTNVYNLAGGIAAWSAEIDPSVPNY